ncbi:MAG TPA: MarR family winged helix-turn-helix transcriptional regulator [Candidatus Dormibacteraeota bacterium]|nr:MarR family winged helix-turn-helix transcriptional regulator [Candidatus Dormibacteraeota bacterium]
MNHLPPLNSLTPLSLPPPLDLGGTGYCASLNFRRTARAVTRLYDEALQSSGIRSTQFAILVGVRKAQPISIGALGQTLGIDPTTLTRSLRLLQKEGLLTVSKRGVRRQRFVSLSAKGDEALGRAIPLWREIQARFVDTIGGEYWLNLRSELERLAGVAAELETAP